MTESPDDPSAVPLSDDEEELAADLQREADGVATADLLPLDDHGGCGMAGPALWTTYAATVALPQPCGWFGAEQQQLQQQQQGTQHQGGRRPLHKERFCATFPDVSICRHGSSCSFAHSREEVRAPLLSEAEEAAENEALTHEFFTQRFKTLWCPIGGQHDWQACMYAHTYQDVRRPPAIGYGHQLCPYWNKKDTSLAYSQRCPLGPRCPYAHGAKEQLYHPGYFRTLTCRDLLRRKCPRGRLCAFLHKQADGGKAATAASKADLVNYSVPLSKESLPRDWVVYFLSPPRFQETASSTGPLMDGAPMTGWQLLRPEGADMGHVMPCAPSTASRWGHGDGGPWLPQHHAAAAAAMAAGEEMDGDLEEGGEDAEDTASSTGQGMHPGAAAGWAASASGSMVLAQGGGCHSMLPSEPWREDSGGCWAQDVSGWCALPYGFVDGNAGGLYIGAAYVQDPNSWEYPGTNAIWPGAAGVAAPVELQDSSGLMQPSLTEPASPGDAW